MFDELEPIVSGNSEPGNCCPLCKRTFAQESTRKRHYYYCRSKPSDTNISRRRSCGTCIRAKTRCTWLADTSLDACIRCNKRGAKCDYDTAARRHRISSQGDIGSASGEALHRGRDSEIPENTTASILTRRSNRAESLQVSTSVKTYQNIVAPLGASVDGDWDADFGEIDTVGLENMLVANQDINFMSCAFSKVSSVLVTGTSSSSPWTQQLSSLSLFNTRAFTKPSQVPLVSLAMRILRSYPFMILQKGMLPPFMSPLLYSWAETGKGPPQQALINCVSLVRMFKSRTEANENFIWRLVGLEQERILTEYSQFDRWELLAALQALLIYCLLRLQDVPVGHDVFNVSLLTAVNLVSSALASSIGERCDCELPDDPALAWRDWIFNESRRRAYLSDYQHVSRHINYCLLLFYMWDVEVWRTEFKLCYEERTMYGLSEAGALTRLQIKDAGIQFSIAKWEEWSAEVSDIGTLVMIVGELLNAL